MTTANATEEDEIACLLSEQEQTQQSDEAHQHLFPSLLAVEELADGYG